MPVPNVEKSIIDDYFTTLLAKINPTDKESLSIEKSIDHLKKNIWASFQDDLDKLEVFGSYKRGSMLSPSVDSMADVDVLIILKKNAFAPQTYLNHIQKLSEKTYARSDVFPNHPTIVVELDHIRFELVPAYWEGSFLSNDLKIPAPRNKEEKWVDSDLYSFNERVKEKNRKENGKIIPLVQIIKYWNIINGRPFDSYYLEDFATQRGYPYCRTLKDYFYELVGDLYNSNKNKKIEPIVERLFEKRRRLLIMEEGKMLDLVYSELNSFLPYPLLS